MRNLLFLLLISASCFGQKAVDVKASVPLSVTTNTPLDVKSSVPLLTYPDLKSMADSEGRPWGWGSGPTTVTTSGTVVAGSAPGYVTYALPAVNLTSLDIRRGRALLLSGGSIGCDKAIQGTYSVGGMTDVVKFPVQFEYSTANYSTPAGGSFTFSQSGAVRFGGKLLNVYVAKLTEPISGTVTPVVGTTATVTFTYTESLNGTMLTDDLNPSAEYVIDIYADSKLYGVGTTDQPGMVAYRIANYYADKGYNVRLRNNSIPGATSSQIENLQLSKRFNFPVKSRLIAVDLSTNDLPVPYSPDSTARTVVRIINRAIKQNTSVTGVQPKVLVMATLPRENPTLNTNANATSTAIQSAITALANPNVVYVPETRTAWTNTDLSFYVSEATEKLHPNDKGNLTWFNILKPYLDAYIPTLPKP